MTELERILIVVIAGIILGCAWAIVELKKSLSRRS